MPPLDPSLLERLLDRSVAPDTALEVLVRHLAGVLGIERPVARARDLPSLQRLALELLERTPPAGPSGPPERLLEGLGGVSGQSERIRYLLLHRGVCTRPAAIEALFGRAQRLRSTAPSEALGYAELALLAASLLPPGLSRERRRYTARARLLEGNVHRITGRFSAAQEALGRVRPLLRGGSDLYGPYHAYSAALAQDRRRFAEALGHLDRAEALARGGASPAPLGRVLTQRALVLSAMSRLGEARRFLAEARPHLDPSSADPGERDLALCVAHNHALLLLDAGAPRRAMERYQAAPELYEGDLTPDRRLRHEWLLGHFARHEDGAAARGHLQRARELAVGLGQTYPVSLLDLDLAVLYLDAGRRGAAAEAARRGVDVLGMLDLPAAAIRPFLALTEALAGPEPFDPGALAALLASLRHARVPPHPQGTPS